MIPNHSLSKTQSGIIPKLGLGVGFVFFTSIAMITTYAEWSKLVKEFTKLWIWISGG